MWSLWLGSCHDLAFVGILELLNEAINFALGLEGDFVATPFIPLRRRGVSLLVPAAYQFLLGGHVLAYAFCMFSD